MAKGIIHKTDKGWAVEYDLTTTMQGYTRELPIHPEDVQHCEEGKEVEFEQKFYWYSGKGFEWNDNGYHVAKLILPKPSIETWDDVKREYFENTPSFLISCDSLLKFLMENYHAPIKK